MLAIGSWSGVPFLREGPVFPPTDYARDLHEQIVIAGWGAQCHQKVYVVVFNRRDGLIAGSPQRVCSCRWVTVTLPRESMVEQHRKQLKEAFTSYLPLPAHLEPHLREALVHVLGTPGRLVRPEIVLKMGLGFGLPEAAATDLAVGLEYFHTASLLFDDLPSMDDATERRGIRCAHLEFGDAGAILAALALVNRAYALTWRAASACVSGRQSQGLAYVEQQLGLGGLLNGQSMDLHYAMLPHDQQTTEQIATGKTVSLIRLTLVLPAILGDASTAELQILERIALYWGLSYQIVDDLKDLRPSSAETGKTVCRDLSLDRPNIALAIGIGGAVERLTRLLHLGDRMLHRLIAIRPAVDFLQTFRAELGEEALQLTEDLAREAVGWAE
jgi:geranylgeranyl diphosphate synthase, type II